MLLGAAHGSQTAVLPHIFSHILSCTHKKQEKGESQGDATNDSNKDLEKVKGVSNCFLGLGKVQENGGLAFEEGTDTVGNFVTSIAGAIGVKFDK